MKSTIKYAINIIPGYQNLEAEHFVLAYSSKIYLTFITGIHAENDSYMLPKSTLPLEFSTRWIGVFLIGFVFHLFINLKAVIHLFGLNKLN